MGYRLAAFRLTTKVTLLASCLLINLANGFTLGGPAGNPAAYGYGYGLGGLAISPLPGIADLTTSIGQFFDGTNTQPPSQPPLPSAQNPQQGANEKGDSKGSDTTISTEPAHSKQSSDQEKTTLQHHHGRHGQKGAKDTPHENAPPSDSSHRTGGPSTPKDDGGVSAADSKTSEPQKSTKHDEANPKLEKDKDGQSSITSPVDKPHKEKSVAISEDPSTTTAGQDLGQNASKSTTSFSTAPAEKSPSDTGATEGENAGPKKDKEPTKKEEVKEGAAKTETNKDSKKEAEIDPTKGSKEEPKKDQNSKKSKEDSQGESKQTPTSTALNPTNGTGLEPKDKTAQQELHPPLDGNGKDKDAGEKGRSELQGDRKSNLVPANGTSEKTQISSDTGVGGGEKDTKAEGAEGLADAAVNSAALADAHAKRLQAEAKFQKAAAHSAVTERAAEKAAAEHAAAERAAEMDEAEKAKAERELTKAENDERKVGTLKSGASIPTPNKQHPVKSIASQQQTGDKEGGPVAATAAPTSAGDGTIAVTNDGNTGKGDEQDQPPSSNSKTPTALAEQASQTEESPPSDGAAKDQ